MVFETECEIKVNGKTIYATLEFNGYAKLLHYSPAKTNCAADYASDTELDYECEEVDISDINFSLCNDNGDEVNSSNFNEEEFKFIKQELKDTANSFVNNHDWSYYELTGEYY